MCLHELFSVIETQFCVCVCLVSLQAVGQLGSVQGVNNDGNVAVLMKAHLWTFNPLSLRRAEKEEEQGVSSEPATLYCHFSLSLICGLLPNMSRVTSS